MGMISAQLPKSIGKNNNSLILTQDQFHFPQLKPDNLQKRDEKRDSSHLVKKVFQTENPKNIAQNDGESENDSNENEQK